MLKSGSLGSFGEILTLVLKLKFWKYKGFQIRARVETSDIALLLTFKDTNSTKTEMGKSVSIMA